MTTSHARSTQIQLVSRPQGWPAEADFRTVVVELPELADGEVRVRNTFVSVDPYMRGRMNDVKSYVPPFALGETLTGGAVGRVVESRSADLPVGALVLHEAGWRDVAQGPAQRFRAVPEPGALPESAYLGILGLTGLTAYVGLTDIARIVPGDTVFVSGAAGAVGSAVGQIARQLGAARVIGSAGGDEKVRMLTERYGFDAALDYRAAPIAEQLPALVPGGVDVFFDNVGGDHLEAGLAVMNRDGRIALCGAIAGYNETERVPGPTNMSNVITRSLTLRGFTLGAWQHRGAEFVPRMLSWLGAGDIVFDETVVDGIDRTVEAFLDMMRGRNVGKMVVRV